jgi:hypothetical protein
MVLSTPKFRDIFGLDILYVIANNHEHTAEMFLTNPRLGLNYDPNVPSLQHDQTNVGTEDVTYHYLHYLAPVHEKIARAVF